MRKDLRFFLKEKLQPKELEKLIKSYDIIGDIAVFRAPENLRPKSPIVAEAIMKTHKHVRTVLLQAGAVSGEFRLRKLRWIMGERKTETVHREFGCDFKVDLETCYFSPRLSFERMRLARLVKPTDTVLNMFAGVGNFSILMAKHGGAQTVYSIDLNPSAFKFMRENVRLNRVQGQVIPILGDARKVITERLQKAADRVVMPLPEKAYEYLDCAVRALKLEGGWIHYYDFEHATKKENPVEKVETKVSGKLQRLCRKFTASSGRVVRATGPNWYQVVLDISCKPEEKAMKEVSKP